MHTYLCCLFRVPFLVFGLCGANECFALVFPSNLSIISFTVSCGTVWLQRSSSSSIRISAMALWHPFGFVVRDFVVCGIYILKIPFQARDEACAQRHPKRHRLLSHAFAVRRFAQTCCFERPRCSTYFHI